MCTALVIREEYWDRQYDIICEIYSVDRDKLKRWFKDCSDIVNLVEEKVQQLHQWLCKASKILFDSVKKSLKSIIDTFSEFIKTCEITSKDDFYTVCDKLENRMLYLNRQNFIKQEQYYKAQFKLAKVNYNVMNHDRRY